MSATDLADGALIALLVTLALLVVVGVIVGRRGQAAQRCSRCPHMRWDHGTEGCRRCGCERYR